MYALLNNQLTIDYEKKCKRFFSHLAINSINSINRPTTNGHCRIKVKVTVLV